MPLYDFDYGFREVSPDWTQNDIILKLKRTLHGKRFERMVETARESVQYVIDNTPDGRVVWTKTGAAMGHQSMTPARYKDHFWACIEEVFGGDEKMGLIAAGTVMRLVISERAEKWFVKRRDTEKVDLVTGKIVQASEYWVNESFTPRPKPKTRGFAVSDLAAKWGATART